MAALRAKSAVKQGVRAPRSDKLRRRTRDDWLRIAKHALIEGGIERVSIEPLAKRMNVSIGSFYHHFKNRQALHDALLAHWEVTNSVPLFDAVRAAGPDPMSQLEAIFDIWVSETAYDPLYDLAVRAWAHVSAEVSSTLRTVDARRTELLTSIFLALGYDRERAFIRSRITYLTQVGYQDLGITEPREVRNHLRRLYREVLVGSGPFE
jgi:AcrR family transcriptional regulator